jgi:hypothetical protein
LSVIPSTTKTKTKKLGVKAGGWRVQARCQPVLHNETVSKKKKEKENTSTFPGELTKLRGGL